MPTTTVVSLVTAITMPYQNFLSELAKSVQVYGTALASIVLVVCAFGYMGAKGLSPQLASCDLML